MKLHSCQPAFIGFQAVFQTLKFYEYEQCEVHFSFVMYCRSAVGTAAAPGEGKSRTNTVLRIYLVVFDITGSERTHLDRYLEQGSQAAQGTCGPARKLGIRDATLPDNTSQRVKGPAFNASSANNSMVCCGTAWCMLSCARGPVGAVLPLGLQPALRKSVMASAHHRR